MPTQQLEGVAAAGPVCQVNVSLDRAAEKIPAALNGNAEISIKIESSPDLVARIVSMSKDATMKAINLTSPGSMGRMVAAASDQPKCLNALRGEREIACHARR